MAWDKDPRWAHLATQRQRWQAWHECRCVAARYSHRPNMMIATAMNEENNSQRFADILAAAARRRAAANPNAPLNMAKREEEARSRYHARLKPRKPTVSG